MTDFDESSLLSGISCNMEILPTTVAFKFIFLIADLKRIFETTEKN